MTAATEEWFTRLRGKVAIAPAHAVRQALENPFVAEQQLVLDFEQPVHGNIRGVAPPVRLDGTDAPRRRAVPRLGRMPSTCSKSLATRRRQSARCNSRRRRVESRPPDGEAHVVE
jgi:crotonobetainyl-CoA:carnitine CoA-transferase CaiB-like acyl-CoA transferase